MCLVEALRKNSSKMSCLFKTPFLFFFFEIIINDTLHSILCNTLYKCLHVCVCIATPQIQEVIIVILWPLCDTSRAPLKSLVAFLLN